MEVKRLMKHNLWVSAVAALSLGLWSCSQDELTIVPDTPIPEPNEQTGAGFLGFELKDADISSRSTHKEYDDDYERFEWFNKGTKEERAIITDSTSNRVLFFNADYSYYGSGMLQKPTVQTTNSNIYVARKPADVTGFPAYALVVLNSDPTRLDILDTELTNAGTDAVRKVLNYLNEVDTDNPESLAMYKGYFTMSSTAYRGEDTDTISVLTPLNPAGPVFYETQEEAVMPENLTTFYVERILAKFTLIIRDGNQTFGGVARPIIIDGSNTIKVRINYAPEDGQQKDEYPAHWKINLVNWGMNGLEKNTYLVKTLTEGPSSFPWSIDDNFYTAWNSPTLFRSYWGLDENYYTGFYPDQYRQALDDQFTTAATTDNIYSPGYDASKGLTKDDYTLIYKPYSAFTDRTDSKYSLENTFDESVMANQMLNTQPWLRCGTHIILTAQLLIDEIDTGIDLGRPQVDETGFIKGVADKYFSNGMYWSETALKQQAVATLMTNLYYNKKGESYQIPDVINGGFIEYINKDTMPLDTDVPVLVVDNGEKIPLVHDSLAVYAEKYFEFAPAFIKGGDGWVTLKLKDGYSLMANYLKRNANGTQVGFDPQPITNAQLVSYIYRFTNLAKHYKEGRMYYAIAIRHNLDSRSFEENPVTQVLTGDYGVVRNTWYRMSINSILNPGTPVDDPDQPIIPNPEPDDKSLGVEVEIIPWRTIDINVDQLH